MSGTVINVENESDIESETASTTFSFILPTLNEERLIAAAVGQFTGADGSLAYDVIVADGGSSDRTVEIARKLGARTYVDHGNPRTIASGRNLGARHAAGEFLVFCDADTQIEDLDQFLQRVLEAFRDERLVGAIPRLKVFPAERTWPDRLFSALLNLSVRLTFLLRCPHAGGQCQIVRRTSFHAVQGYNPRQVHGEDSALFQKLAKIGRIRFLPDVTIFESPRRYRKLGYVKLIAISLYSLLGQAIFRRNVLESWKRVD